MQATVVSSSLGSPGDFQREHLKLNFRHANNLKKLPKEVLFFGNSHLPEKTANTMNTGTDRERGIIEIFDTHRLASVCLFPKPFFPPAGQS